MSDTNIFCLDLLTTIYLKNPLIISNFLQLQHRPAVAAAWDYEQLYILTVLLIVPCSNSDQGRIFFSEIKYD